MPALNALRAGLPALIQPAPRDPAPSRLGYRLNRLWLRPSVRRLVRFGPPLLAAAFAVWSGLTNPDIRAAVTGTVAAWRNSLAALPELAVERIEVPGVSADLRRQVLEVASVALPISALDLDLESLRLRVEGIDAVESATVHLSPAGALEIAITERTPVAVWRSDDGLFLVDAGGFRVARLAARGLRSDLMLIAGLGAPQAVAEAMALRDAAGPLQGRIRGFVRQGERRWDVILDRGLTISLPEESPRAALERVIALDKSHDILARDLLVIDMRDARRPILRLSEQAVRELRRIRTAIPGEDT